VTYNAVITPMDWDKTLRLLAAIFGVLGSGVVTYSIMEVTPENLLPRIVTFWDYNSHLIDIVAREKADKIAGFHLLIMSFLFSTASVLAPKGRRPWLVVLILGLSVVLFWVVWSQRNEAYRETKFALEKLAKEFIEKGEIRKP
jgi:hypothetical protein